MPETPYRFGSFTFDPATGELAEGRVRTTLAPTPAKLLGMLLDRAGELVPREQIYEALWGERHIDAEHGLNSCVLQLRRALGDDALSPRFIETVRGRGYRFRHAAPRGRARRPSGRLAFGLAALLALLLGLPPRTALHPRDPAAIDAYIAGGFLVSRGDPAALEQAAASFSRALSIDPEFVDARAGLAEAWVHMGRAGIAPTLPALTRAAREAERALASEPGHARAALARGLAELYATLDWRRAEPYFARAAADGASLGGRLWHARSLAALGEPDRAIEEADSLLAEHPDYTAALFDQGWFYYLAGRFNEAVDVSHQVLEIAPEAWQAWASLLASELARGNHAEAANAARRMTGTLLGEEELGEATVDDPDSYLRAATERLHEACPTHSLALERAQILSLLGDREAALAALRSGIERRLFWSPFVSGDPAFASLRTDPRFVALLSGSDSTRG